MKRELSINGDEIWDALAKVAKIIQDADEVV